MPRVIVLAFGIAWSACLSETSNLGDADALAVPVALKGASLWWTAPVIFFLVLRFGKAPALDLDSGWAAVLRWAFAHRSRFGSEIVFTFGPLGFLFPRSA